MICSVMSSKLEASSGIRQAVSLSCLHKEGLKSAQKSGRQCKVYLWDKEGFVLLIPGIDEYMNPALKIRMYYAGEVCEAAAEIAGT